MNLGKMFFDSHCHLQMDKIFKHWQSIKIQCFHNRIGAVTVCGVTPGEDWRRIEEMYNENPKFVVPSYGLHPWYIRHCDDKQIISCFESLEVLLREYSGAHVGECGLDRIISTPRSDRDNEEIIIPGTDMKLQEEIVTSHLYLAHKYNRSITLHCVKVWEPLYELLFQYDKRHFNPLEPSQRIRSIVLHSCNRIPIKTAKKFLEMQVPVYFSLCGIGMGGGHGEVHALFSALTALSNALCGVHVEEGSDYPNYSELITPEQVNIIQARVRQCGEYVLLQTVFSGRVDADGVLASRLLIESDAPDQIPLYLRESQWQRDLNIADHYCNIPVHILMNYYLISIALEIPVNDIVASVTVNYTKCFL